MCVSRRMPAGPSARPSSLRPAYPRRAIAHPARFGTTGMLRSRLSTDAVSHMLALSMRNDIPFHTHVE
jgi:hypothetical protein